MNIFLFIPASLEGEGLLVYDSLAAGGALRLKVELGQMDLLIIVGQSVAQENSRGLLGTIDGDPTNDLTTPNGTVLPVDSSIESIYHNFGQLCE